MRSIGGLGRWWRPSNGFTNKDLCIDRSANLLLTDFGSAAPLLDDTSATDKRHAVGKVPWRYCEQPVGTPDYIAPEVLQIAEEAFIASESSLYPQDDSRAGYDVAVDWWSLGVTLFEMAFGCSPFYSATISATYAKIIACPSSLVFPATPSLPNQLLHLITCLLRPRARRLFGPEILGLSTLEQGGQRVEEARAQIAGHLLPIGLHGDNTLDSLCGSDFSLPYDKSYGSSEMDSSRPDGALNPPSHRWIGWTWHPSSDLMSQQAVERTQQENSPLPSTPHRKLRVISKTPERRRAPPSSSPLRVMSKQAEAGELLQCVQASASKRRGQTAATLVRSSSASLQHDLTRLNRGIQVGELMAV
ncbi:kinase-like domain-containing protein [Naematelia encephala]|uniref:Kinase-like domain-containing protein n=1 Tax=Naematelia encephala TaxID=71784 RepID=A0A1Y2BIZ9_9TREE|nr:kinase-like domain-containing protein [Naematelia encephala]